MKNNVFLIALVACLTAFSVLAAPEKEAKEKRAGVTDYPFWTTKKRGETPQFVPGLNAALQLTPAQEEQIATARGEAANDEAAKAARGLSKNDPSVTAEQREKARAVLDAANAKLRERVAKILTPEQSALIAKINSAYADTVDEIGTIYADKFAVKGDEAARKRVQEEKSQDTTDRFLSKLDTLLTPAQKDAMTRAAEVDKSRDDKAAAAAGAKKAAK